MNIKSFQLIILVLSVSMISCNQNNVANYEELESEVMAIHDSVMPQMTKIYYDRQQLEEWILEDSLGQITPDLKEDVSSSIRELRTAEDAMWQWMSDFDDVREQVKPQPDSIKILYMEERKSSIIRVRDMMLSSMAKADSLQNIIGKENN